MRPILDLKIPLMGNVGKINKDSHVVAFGFPLVDELKELWDGINVYNVSRPIAAERSFTFYGICAYTTHDYPGLGVCSGKLHV